MPPVIAEDLNENESFTYPGSNKIEEMSTSITTVDDEYKKNPTLKKSDIDHLKEWIKTQDNLPSDISEVQLILFHHSCYYNLEATKACMNVYYTLRVNTPEFFMGRDVNLPNLQNALSALQYGTFPVRDPNGYQIIFHRLQVYDASKYVFADGVKLLAMAVDACLHVDGTAPGYIFVFDLTGVRLSHLTRLGISAIKKFFLYVQEGMPVRLQAIHVLNTRPIIDKIMIFIRPFLKKELLKLIHFHGPDDMEEVYKVLPKKCLPSDFGGELSSCEKLHENFIEWMKRMQKTFEEVEKTYTYLSNEKKKNKGSSKTQKEANITLQNLEID